MGSMNRVFLMGNLTREVELRYTPNGAAVAELGMAMNRKYGENGENEEVTFVDVVVWNKQAENCSAYLKKGSSALIEGRLQLDTWQDKETGKNRSRLRVVAERVQFLGGGQQQAQVSQLQAQAPQQPQYNGTIPPSIPQQAPQQPQNVQQYQQQFSQQ